MNFPDELFLAKVTPRIHTVGLGDELGTDLEQNIWVIRDAVRKSLFIYNVSFCEQVHKGMLFNV